MVPRSMVVYKGTILNFFHLAERINLLERSVKKLSREDKFLSTRIIGSCSNLDGAHISGTISRECCCKLSGEVCAEFPQ